MAMTKPDYLVKLESTLLQSLESCRQGTPAWQQAYNRFKEVGLPSPRGEAWRHAPLRQLSEIPQPRVVDAQQVVDITSYDGIPCNVNVQQIDIVFVDGRYDAQLSSDLAQTPISLHEELAASPRDDADGFDCLNCMLCPRKTQIDIQTSVEKPIHIHYLCSQSQPWIANNISLSIAENAHARIVENHCQYPQMEMNAAATAIPEMHLQQFDIECQKHACLKLASMLHLKDGVHAINKRRIKLHTESSYKQFTLAAGGSWCRHSTYTELLDEACYAQINSLTLNSDDNTIETQTQTCHRAESCQSSQMHKTLSWDKSRTLFDGLIAVDKQAQQTDAMMSNHNLMLSDKARIHTKPQLEIYADDVRCTHGVTSGQLDDDANLYLRSRGIDKEMANQLLINAFAIEALPDWLDEEVTAKSHELLSSYA